MIRDALSSSNRSSHGKTLVAYLANDQVEHIGTKFGDWLILFSRFVFQVSSLTSDPV